MSFSGKRTRKTTFIQTDSNKIVDGPQLTSFQGTFSADGNNILSMPYGSLQQNKNMEFRNSGKVSFLESRRGYSLIKDIVNAVLGSGLFNDSTYKYPVWVDSSGELKYLDGTTINSISTGKNATSSWEFWMYQLGDNETLYLSNNTDGLLKLTESSGALVEASVLTTISVKSMVYSNISGRFLLASGHRVYYSGIQNQTAANTTNLESFNTSTNWFWVNPDVGDGIQKLVDNGEITFIFKDTGIWAFINAEEDISNWLIPQTKADVGTRSKDTVQYARYGQLEGFIYLGSDRTLRFFDASVERNSGSTPTLLGGSSKIISEYFQDILDDIPSGSLADCKAYYYNRYYILSIVTSSGSSINKTLIIDTEKLQPREAGQDINQPFWWFSEDLNFNSYILFDYDSLYGFNVSGYIAKLFVNGKIYDQIPERITPDTEFRDVASISSLSGTFYTGETITGSSSGTTGKLESDAIDTLYIKDVDAEWTTGETLTGSSSGATCTLDSYERRKAIDWESYLAWYRYSAREVQFYDGYLHWSSDALESITFTLNSFIYGESIPAKDDTIDISLTIQDTGGSYFDLSYFDDALFDAATSNQSSQNIGEEITGNFFSFGFKSSGYGSSAKIFGLDTRFKLYKNDVMGKNA